jgi:hypothetical protein
MPTHLPARPRQDPRYMQRGIEQTPGPRRHRRNSPPAGSTRRGRSTWRCRGPDASPVLPTNLIRWPSLDLSTSPPRVRWVATHSRIGYLGAVSRGNASTICCPVQAALGFVVTLNWRIRQRWLPRIRRMKSTRNIAAGTAKKTKAPPGGPTAPEGHTCADENDTTDRAT